jgi:hypothetical protein
MSGDLPSRRDGPIRQMVPPPACARQARHGAPGATLAKGAAVLTANRSPDCAARLVRGPPRASDTKCRMPALRTSCCYDGLRDGQIETIKENCHVAQASYRPSRLLKNSEKC